MKVRYLTLTALLTLTLVGCASTPSDYEPSDNCATTRAEEARRDMAVCDTPHYLRHEPFLERREVRGS